jgi:hypothetical protein
MTTPDSERGYDLALALKLQMLERRPQPDAASILHCCCWLLADVITQAAAQRHTTREQAFTAVLVTLHDAVERLERANAEADAAGPRTH